MEGSVLMNYHPSTINYFKQEFIKIAATATATSKGGGVIRSLFRQPQGQMTTRTPDVGQYSRSPFTNRLTFFDKVMGKKPRGIKQWAKDRKVDLERYKRNILTMRDFPKQTYPGGERRRRTKQYVKSELDDIREVKNIDLKQAKRETLKARGQLALGVGTPIAAGYALTKTSSTTATATSKAGGVVRSLFRQPKRSSYRRGLGDYNVTFFDKVKGTRVKEFKNLKEHIENLIARDKRNSLLLRENPYSPAAKQRDHYRRTVLPEALEDIKYLNQQIKGAKKQTLKARGQLALGVGTPIAAGYGLSKTSSSKTKTKRDMVSVAALPVAATLLSEQQLSPNTLSPRQAAQRALQLKLGDMSDKASKEEIRRMGRKKWNKVFQSYVDRIASDNAKGIGLSTPRGKEMVHNVQLMDIPGTGGGSMVSVPTRSGKIRSTVISLDKEVLGPSILKHELGHATRKTKADRTVRKLTAIAEGGFQRGLTRIPIKGLGSAAGIATGLGIAATAAGNPIKVNTKGYRRPATKKEYDRFDKRMKLGRNVILGSGLVLESPLLLEEARASARALKATRPKHLLQAIKTLAPAYGTYVVGAAGKYAVPVLAIEATRRYIKSKRPAAPKIRSSK